MRIIWCAIWIFLLIGVSRANGQVVITTAYNQMPMRTEAFNLKDVLAKVPIHTNLSVTDYVTYGKSYGYFKVLYNDTEGFMHEGHFIRDESFEKAKEMRLMSAKDVYRKNKKMLDKENRVKFEMYYTSETLVRQMNTVGDQEFSMRNAKIPSAPESNYFVPKPTAPPSIEISEIVFSEEDNENMILNAGESIQLEYDIINSGQGSAYNLITEITLVESVMGLEISNPVRIKELKSGQSASVKIAVKGTMKLASGNVRMEIEVKEGNGFDSDPITVTFPTVKFKNPLVSISDYEFSLDETGRAQVGKVITLKLIVQNKGQGSASDIKVQFSNPENIFPVGETVMEIDKLDPNEGEIINYEFFVNKRYDKEIIPITVNVLESYKEYGDNRVIDLPLNKELQPSRVIDVKGKYEESVLITELSLKSDVDKNIPKGKALNKNKYALVIGNEDYKSFQPGLSNEQNVAYAINDAVVVNEYLKTTLGYPSEHILLVKNGTKGQMMREIQAFIELTKFASKPEVFVYYAGHGLPDFNTQEAYLIPVDVSSSHVNNGISLNELYGKLSEIDALKITIFLDACFSGGGRGENGLLAARAVKIKPKGGLVEGNMVVFTASSGDQVSLPLERESHGLFTYYLLRKLKDSNGEVTLGALKDYLSSEVPKASIIENRQKQSPQVLFSPDVRDKWMDWEF